MTQFLFKNHLQSGFTKLIALLSLCCWAGQIMAIEPSVSEPLDEPLEIHERLVSDESVEVPPEPVPPAEYQGLDALTPALIAEEILRLRDSLGEAPLSGRAAFQLLPLGNRDKDTSHSPAELAFDQDDHFQTNQTKVNEPAPGQREEDRRLLAQRLRGMASRPMFSRPHLGPPAEVHSQHPLDLPPVPCEMETFQNYTVPTYVPVTQYLSPHTLPHPEPPRYLHPAENVAETQINVLRETARQLEESAHHLECQEQFERADQIRELAQKLRMDAREQRDQKDANQLHTVRPVVRTEGSQACGVGDYPVEVPQTAIVPQYGNPLKTER